MSPTSGFSSLLVANRGEIAVRVIRSARALGLRTIAVHSDADADAPHVHLADVAVPIGPAPASQSYLRIEAILEAAAATGAEAIHPGYGFLAENAAFAQACADAGLVFVGPPAGAIEAMGDKAAAKRLMLGAGVPVLPGYQDAEQADDRLLAEAAAVGFPLMVKAAAGGGGKGMRLVEDAAGLPESLAAARREALGAFGSDVLILERALLTPRHVEIQVLADAHGRTLWLGERDCSVQRRHQKVVEEAPSPAVDAGLRARMGAAAVAAAEAVGYVGAGTVEFLLQDGEFFFLEMNTRLQVEHPVTELVTGLDLVAWQLRIAQGEALTLVQDDVRLDGHAIEVRLYAEDPANGFLPATGRIERFAVPEGVRVDAGVAAGSVVTADYDPMLAKVIAHGPDRDTARVRLANALEQATVLGVRTNRSFLVDVLRHPEFAAGAATTAFLAASGLPASDDIPPELVAACAAILTHHRHRAAARRSPGLAGFSSLGASRTTLALAIDGEVDEVVVARSAGALAVEVAGVAVPVAVDDRHVTVGGQTREYAAVVRDVNHALVRIGARDLEVRDVLLAPADGAGLRGDGVLVAPMHGAVTAVLVEPGQHVRRGERVAIVEAMKMEHAVVADIDGVVAEVAVTPGAQVAADALLARIEPASEPASELDA